MGSVITSRGVGIEIRILADDRGGSESRWGQAGRQGYSICSSGFKMAPFFPDKNSSLLLSSLLLVSYLSTKTYLYLILSLSLFLPQFAFLLIVIIHHFASCSCSCVLEEKSLGFMATTVATALGRLDVGQSISLI